MKFYPKNKGFTLVELLVAIVILGIFAAISVSVLGGGVETKTTTVLSKAQEVSNAVMMYKKNTGCVPSYLAVLFDKTQATAANNFCGAGTTASYGTTDYMPPMPVNAATKFLLLDELGVSGATMISRKNLSGTTGNNYALEIYNLGDELMASVLGKCNGVDYTGVPKASYPHDFTNGAACVYVTADDSVGVLITRY